MANAVFFTSHMSKRVLIRNISKYILPVYIINDVVKN